MFTQLANNHMRGQGCPTCGNVAKAESKRKRISEFVVDAIQVHGQLYDYAGVVYKNKDTKISILCKRCNVAFSQTPGNHLAGNGCPRCLKRISKQETEWLDGLGVDVAHRQTLVKVLYHNYKVDGYKPETNTVYEFYGDYWHGNPIRFNKNDFNQRSKKTFGELYQQTLQREELIKKAGYNLISIWETDYEQNCN
jgi:hypothetical protein